MKLLNNLPEKPSIKSIVEENYQNPNFSIDDICQMLDISRMTLYRRIQEEFGYSPAKFLQSYRLQKAKPLLIDGDLNISQIAYQVGFNDPNYFTRTFVKKFGETPRDFKKNNS